VGAAVVVLFIFNVGIVSFFKWLLGFVIKRDSDVNFLSWTLLMSLNALVIVVPQVNSNAAAKPVRVILSILLLIFVYFLTIALHWIIKKIIERVR
jgi:hypothetical protein